jgi:hypothetical protein
MPERMDDLGETNQRTILFHTSKSESANKKDTYRKYTFILAPAAKIRHEKAFVKPYPSI